MKTKNSIYRFSKHIFYLLLTTVLITSCGYGVYKNDDLYKTLEQAYFEGQRDALQNDIRIKRNADSCWIWTKSPWDNGRPPMFDPSFECQ
jgi:hypothetical protein